MNTVFVFLGFILLCLLMVKLSLFGFLLIINNLGQYNIGGAVNSPIKKLVTIVVLMGIVYLWYLLIFEGPIDFSIGVRK